MTRRAIETVAALVALTSAMSACGGLYRAIPYCSRTDNAVFVLLAQSVPTATQLPCIAELPAGWSYNGSDVSDGEARFWLDSDRAGFRAVEVALRRSCDTAGAVEEQPAPDEAGTQVFARPTSLTPAFRSERFLLFDGGCIDYTFRFRSGASSTLAIEAIGALSLLPRATIVRKVLDDPGLSLCGAGAPPCTG
jgi:hypothetical protein